MVIGDKNKTSINNLKTQYQNQGWTLVDKDLNAGAGGAYIYMLYRTNKSQNYTSSAIVDFYFMVSDNSTTPPAIVRNGLYYHLAPYTGSDSFENSSGDLNNSAGGKFIHLYYAYASIICT